MGGAVSTDLKSHEKDAVTKKLKQVYDEMNKSDLSNEEIQAKLAEEFKKLVKSFHPQQQPHSPHHLAPTVASNNKSSISAKSHDSEHTHSFSSTTSTQGGSLRKGRSTRRRSFDVEQNKKPTRADSIKLADTNQTLVSKSAQTLPTATDIAVDSWDSVTTQPFCEICKMAFKSAAFLERHIKYSNLHADNVRRLQEGDTGLIEAHPATRLTHEHVTTTKQEEGVHYRLLYSGTKFYWRSQQSIDLDIYHHFFPNTIEIIPFHVTKNKELSRIYLDYELVLQQVHESIQEEIMNRKNLLLSDKFTAPSEIDEKKLRLEVTLIKVVNFILHRITFDPKLPAMLQQIKTANESLGIDGGNASVTHTLKQLNDAILSSGGGGGGGGSGDGSQSARSGDSDEQCGFTALFDDDVKLYPVLHDPPVILVPINVVRRRRSTAEEFDSEMKSMSIDQTMIKANLGKAEELTKANARAEKIASFVYLAAQHIRDKKSRFHEVEHKYRRLWLWAIHRIIHQNNVVKNRKVLDAKGWNIIPKSPYKPARIREQPVLETHTEQPEDPNLRLSQH